MADSEGEAVPLPGQERQARRPREGSEGKPRLTATTADSAATSLAHPADLAQDLVQAWVDGIPMTTGSPSLGASGLNAREWQSPNRFPAR